MTLDEPVWSVLGRGPDGTVVVADLNADGTERRRTSVDSAALASRVRAAGPARRWVWSDATRWYPPLLAAGVVVARCHDLRLCHTILRGSAFVTDAAALRAHPEWDGPAADAVTPAAETLFELDERGDASSVPDGIDEALAEFARQRAALEGATAPGRLRLLLAAESAGAVIAVELHAAGLPWDAGVHDAILVDLLGPRPAAGRLPARIEELAVRVRDALGDPAASLDSQPKLLRALHRVGVLATSTSRWELAQYDHPVIAPLLEYKKLMRLLSANGWAWMEEWAAEGRFRPVYVPGGVVTGRWASSGGGALQLPRQLRPAVRADPGWLLIIADVAQLEPRVLAAMAGDTALADAARGQDLYAGVVAGGVVATRQEAKGAILGAMYGATTGDSGRLVPALRRAYPRAMTLVDEAARIGEDGGIVTTWLGRSAPAPSSSWRDVQRGAGAIEATAADESRARRSARDRGRFTRNFIVQGTAAEWALAWMADVRGRLAAFDAVEDAGGRSGPVFGRRAHLAFFLHDEIVVHAPAAQAEAAAEAVRAAADGARRLLFGDFPLDFPLDLRIAEDAGKA